MTDDVVLTIDGKAYRKFTSLDVDANIYQAAGQFDAEFSRRNAQGITTGSRAVITVNSIQVFDGIVESVQKGISKESDTVTISGRDIMGLVVDWCVERFQTLRNKTLAQVAGEYLRLIPFVKNIPIVFVDGADKLDVAQEYVQPSPGQTVFDLLNGIASARGINFYMRPAGTFVFGKPKGFGSVPSTIGPHNSLSLDFSDDISQRFSRVTVYGQAQSSSLLGASQLGKKATVNDTDLAVEKPLVIETGMAGVSVSKQARMILEQQRFNGWQLRYTVRGFSQMGRPWQPDTLCSVRDYRLPYIGQCLVYGRRFSLRKSQFTTSLTLGKTGVSI